MKLPDRRTEIEEELIDLHVVEQHREAIGTLAEVAENMGRPCDCGCQRFIYMDLLAALRRYRTTLMQMGE